MKGSESLKVLVCDAPQDGELNWLMERLADSCAELEHINRSELLEAKGLDNFGSTSSLRSRIVFCCPDRLSYRPALFHQLARTAPDIPAAIATSSWWEGSIRTGVKHSTLPFIPWYRWHDGWTNWLTGHCPQLFSPLPARPLGRLGKSSLAQYCDVHILANDKAIAKSWESYLSSEDLRQRQYTTSSFHGLDECRQAGRAPPELVLWDDSCLGSTPLYSPKIQSEIGRQIHSLHQTWPNATLATAFTMPRWETWQTAMSAGADEILGKPLG